MKKKNSIFKLAMFATLYFAQSIWAQVWNETIDSEWYWDNPSQAEFTITTAAQLAGLAQLVNGGNSFLDKTIKLSANIMLNDTANWLSYDTKKPTNIWTSIGSYTDEKNNRPFSGTFDGGGYVVSGVYINNENGYQGLFGYADSSATIKNLGVIASFVEGENDNIGSLVGWNSGTITNCYTTGNVKGNEKTGGLIKGGANVGGLVGSNSGTITDCYATGNVTGRMPVGGLVGSNSGAIKNCYATGYVKSEGVWNNGYIGGLVGSNRGTITNCYATGNIQGRKNVGGLVGENEGGTIMNCYATGNVQGSEDVGGLVGESVGGTITNCYATGNVEGGGGLVGSNSGTITNCYATGNVEGGGGLVGSNSGTITNCYATGNVEGSGGLVGENSGTITNCYATGSVKGSKNVGGLVGSSNENGTIENCYATGNVQGSENIGGLVGSNSGTVMDCYATGGVLGSENVGGLVGSNYKYGTIMNCYTAGKVSGTTGNTIGGLTGTNEGFIKSSYYDRQVSGQSDIVKGEPKSTAQMKQQEIFKGWNFYKIWGIDVNKNSGYPHLLPNSYLQFNESDTEANFTHIIETDFIDTRDKKKYKAVKIDLQTWMAENLNYNASNSECYKNDPANCAKYGRLYDWNTAMESCPPGWHLPSMVEYEVLDRAVGGKNVAGKKLKAKSGWNENGNGTDEHGFSALPGGYRKPYSDFDLAGAVGLWWSSSAYFWLYAYYWRMDNNTKNTSIASNGQAVLFSVRCLQD